MNKELKAKIKQTIKEALELGFDMELHSNHTGIEQLNNTWKASLYAFNLGRKDAIAGDDCEAVDLIPTFEKVDMIFEKYFGK